MIGDQASRAGIGLAGALGSWAISAWPGALDIAIVTAFSCAFGMLSSMSRVHRGVAGLRSLIMNAGAVWLAAFVIAAKTNADLPGGVLIGLGVGLAGSAVLEVIEKGVLVVARRMVGPEVVTVEELDQRIGDLRNAAQAALSEQIVEKHKEQEGEQ